MYMHIIYLLQAALKADFSLEKAGLKDIVDTALLEAVLKQPEIRSFFDKKSVSTEPRAATPAIISSTTIASNAGMVSTAAAASSAAIPSSATDSITKIVDSKAAVEAETLSETEKDFVNTLEFLKVGVPTEQIKNCAKVYEQLLPYIQLAAQIEGSNLTNPKLNAARLAVLFGSVHDALAYLKKVEKQHPNYTVEKACAFNLPATTTWNYTLWKNLAIKNLPDNPQFFKVIPLADRIEAYVNKRKVELEKNLIAEVEAKRFVREQEVRKKWENKFNKEFDEGVKKEIFLDTEKERKAYIDKKMHENNTLINQELNNNIKNEIKTKLKNILSKDTAIAKLIEYAEIVFYPDQDVEQNVKVREIADYFFEYDVKPETFKSYMKLKTSDNSLNIPDIGLNDAVRDAHYPDLYIIKLPNTDPRNAILGKITGSCQSLDSAGNKYAEVAIHEPTFGCYVLFRSKKKQPNPAEDEIVAESLVWRSVEGNLVMDSIESQSVFKQDHEKAIVEMFTQLAQKLIKEKGVSKVLVGEGGLTPKTMGALSVYYSDTPSYYLQQRDSFKQRLVAENTKNFSHFCQLCFYNKKDLKYINEHLDNFVTATMDKKQLEERAAVLYKVFVEYKGIIDLEHQAFAQKSKKMIELLEQYDLDVNMPDEKRVVSLEKALKNKDIELIEYLVARGAHLNIKDRFGEAEIFYENLLDIIDPMQEDYRNLLPIIDIFAKRKDKNKVMTDFLFKIIKHRNYFNVELLKKLIENGANVNEIRNIYDDSPLIMAINKNNIEWATFMIKNGASALNKGVALALAIQKGIGITALLIKSNPDLNATVTQYSPYTPLSIAIDMGKDDLIKDLLNYASYTPKTLGIALTMAVKEKNKNLVQDLLNKGAPLDCVDPDNGKAKTALMWAVENDDLPMLQLLIKHKADLNQKILDYSTDKPTALSTAVDAKKTQMVETLINSSDDDSKAYAIYRACLNNDLNMVKILLKSKADVDCREAIKHTIHALTLNSPTVQQNKKRLEILSLLLANANAKALGEALIKLIEGNNDIKLINEVLNKGADTTLTMRCDSGDDHSALSIAVSVNNISMRDILLQHKSTAITLGYALAEEFESQGGHHSRKADFAFVEELLKRGADVNIQIDQQGKVESIKERLLNDRVWGKSDRLWFDLLDKYNGFSDQELLKCIENLKPYLKNIKEDDVDEDEDGHRIKAKFKVVNECLQKRITKQKIMMEFARKEKENAKDKIRIHVKDKNISVKVDDVDKNKESEKNVQIIHAMTMPAKNIPKATSQAQEIDTDITKDTDSSHKLDEKGSPKHKK